MRPFRVLAALFAFLFPLTSCDALPLPPELTDGGVLFQFEDPVAEQVHIAGTFNQWSSGSLPMQKEGDKFVLVVPLREGKHEYKYVIDGQFMSGDNLVVNLIRRDGRLYIHPREPYLRFPYTSKIDMDGYYLFYSLLTDEIDGPGGKIRSQTPRNDLDLNFDIHPTDILRAWAQINVNTMSNDDKLNLDEAFLELNMGNFLLRPFETHWNTSFDDPFRILDDHVQHFDDGIFLTDDERPFHHQYGRYARGFGGEFRAGSWVGQFFFSNKVRLDQGALDEDLWGLRLKRQGRWLTWGLTFAQWQIPNGIKADENSDGNTTEKLTKDMGATTIEYPEGSNSFYQVSLISQVRPGGQNKKLQTGFDVSIRAGRWTILTEALVTQNEAAALAYSNGSARRVFGFAYGQNTGTVTGNGAAGFERIFGEQSDGFSMLIGAIFRARTWSNELGVRFHNFRAKSFSGDTGTPSLYTDTAPKNVTPEWIEVVHRMRLNQSLDPSWGLDLESRYVDRTSISKLGNVYYRERIGAGSYFFTEVPWAKRTISERIRFHWRWGSKWTFHTRLKWMNLDRYGKEFGRTDIVTLEGMPFLNWRMNPKWQMDFGARYASVDFGTMFSTQYEADFMKPFAGLKYEWSKLFHIRFWYGLNPHQDEDKKLGNFWRLQELFETSSEYIVTRGQDLGYGASLANTLIETERRFDRESVFGIQAELRF